MYKISNILLAGLVTLASLSPVSPAPASGSFDLQNGDGPQFLKREEDVVNGSPVSWKYWPFIVDLRGLNDSYHVCGGTILDGYTVLTAAHCIFDPVTEARRDHTFFTGHVGSNETAGGGYNFKFHNIIVHPDYYRPTINYDYAIMKTTHNFFTDIPNIGLQSAHLPKNENEIGGGMVVQVAGWGATKYKGHSSPILLQTAQQVVGRAACERVWKPQPITHAMVCANATNFQKGTSICQGDSGGPLVQGAANTADNNAVVYGVVSFTQSCGETGYPDVYSNVFEVVDWIKYYLG